MKETLTLDELRRRDRPLGCALDSIFDGVYVADRLRRIVF